MTEAPAVARNRSIYVHYRFGVAQNVLSKIHGLSRSRIFQIIEREKRQGVAQRRRNALKWPRAGLAVPIPLPGPRDTWLVSTLEGFDIDAMPAGDDSNSWSGRVQWPPD